MAANQQVIDLQQDNKQLYFLLGALLDAIEQTGPLPRQRIKKTLTKKARHTAPPLREGLQNLIEAMFNE